MQMEGFGFDPIAHFYLSSGLRKKCRDQNPGLKMLRIFLTPFKSLHLYRPREGIPMEYPLLVQMEGFEPSSFRRRILSPLCMPFHHICISTIIHPGAGQVNMRKGKGFALTTNRFGSTCFLPPERPCFYGRGTILERVGNPHEGGGGCTLNCFLPTISF